jgi:hypothetical protein
MRFAAVSFTLVAVLASSPVGAHAQTVQEVLATIRNGGGWISVPIVAGRGTASTLTLPTMGLNLTGCVNVWEGHTGLWEIRAQDTVSEATLEATSSPGEGVRFAHEFGIRSQLEFEFQWSEPRDTTLYLWVGLDREDDGPEEACTPKA